MHISLDPSDSRPIYVQIVHEVRRACVLHTLAPGDPLPSVRQLATDLRINPNTVSQAYQELEREGLVEMRRGQGTFATKEAARVRHRHTLARDVASRALRDAHNNGLDADDLVEAIRAVTASHARREAR